MPACCGVACKPLVSSICRHSQRMPTLFFTETQCSTTLQRSPLLARRQVAIEWRVAVLVDVVRALQVEALEALERLLSCRSNA
eukprot:283417-Chlamydomonas_euryale.AAC.1